MIYQQKETKNLISFSISRKDAVRFSHVSFTSSMRKFSRDIRARRVVTSSRVEVERDPFPRPWKR
jgi:hypothetical protein